MKTVMLVFGTRPEAIKMCPLIKELKKRRIETVVCVSAQHRQMLDMVLDAFKVTPDYDLSIMKDKQTLFDITTNILNRIKEVLEAEKPDVVLVHGDTSTTFVTALACFYMQIPVGHVEAGLRTYNIYSPYPEEFNREAVGIISQYNFAPTENARKNLVAEGRDCRKIWGNDAAVQIFDGHDFFLQVALMAHLVRCFHMYIHEIISIFCKGFHCSFHFSRIICMKSPISTFHFNIIHITSDCYTFQQINCRNHKSLLSCLFIERRKHRFCTCAPEPTTVSRV